MADKKTPGGADNKTFWEKSFESFYKFTDPYRQKYRFLSTIFAAFILALIWVGVWLFIFLASTFGLSLQTNILAFIVTFWLSIVAESAIRWAENTNTVARFSKPHAKHPRGDNSDFTWSAASRILSTGVIVIVAVLFGWKALSQGKLRAFVPPQGTTIFQGSILTDRAGLVVRDEECSFYADKDFYPYKPMVSITESGVKVLLEKDGATTDITDTGKTGCPDDYRIARAEKVVIAGPDDANFGQDSISRMLSDWKTVIENPAFLWTILLGIIFRIWIYKRSHREADDLGTHG